MAANISSHTPLALAVALSVGLVTGVAARPVLDDAAFAKSERCIRSSTPDRNGRFQSFTFQCRLADWWVYGPIAVGGEG